MSPNHDIHCDITAVVLAGGASTRMGRDKALLQWRGKPFIAHIIERLQPHVARIALNTNSTSAFADFRLPIVTDANTERCGPLAGIMAALAYSETPLTLIVPCDNPMLSPALIDRLRIALDRGQNDLAYAVCNGDNFYLYAMLRTNLRAQLETFLQAGDYAVRHWYASLRTSAVDFGDQPQYFRNINSTDELAQLPR